MTRFGIAAILCVLTVSSVMAAPPLPFHASIATDISPQGPCGETCVVVAIAGEGQAVHMGRLSVDGPSFIDFASGGQTGTSTLSAADGSTLEIEFHGSFTPTSQTDVTFSGSWTVMSGTGRFADSDGSGTYHGTASLATNTGDLQLDGTVTDTGKH